MPGSRHPPPPRHGRTESPARWALPSSQRARGPSPPALRPPPPSPPCCPIRPPRRPRAPVPSRQAPPLARPALPLARRGPCRCLSRLPRRPLARPGPPRKFEKKKKSFMGGWKGPGQRRGREGPEARRRAAERGGGGGVPAPRSPAREPRPPSCLLLPPPRGAAMTVSAPGSRLRPRPGGGRRPEAEPSQSPPGQPPPHFSEARGGLGLKTATSEALVCQTGLTLPAGSPLAFPRPLAPWSPGDPERSERPVPAAPSSHLAAPVTGGFGVTLSHLPSSPVGEDPIPQGGHGFQGAAEVGLGADGSRRLRPGQTGSRCRWPEVRWARRGGPPHPQPGSQSRDV
ncbi:hypothetical protein P7K49_002929 [Saguinus oedipus]|uniref:Basic proline-rich protein-like n=1 Tax=Saguinus oedipus TaxID=9490 RepID=A0ABQ9WIQ1_SAGOE|nr:hypothetical protein P7K49_002929 [Saguinus oedipus]